MVVGEGRAEMTIDEHPRAHSPGLVRRTVAMLRNRWRQLTSMRTALVLLFLLAAAAVPGALLPQRNLNTQAVDSFIAARPVLGPVMDTLELFDVFASSWFTAIYVLLFVSLIGCLTPRLIEHGKALRAQPVRVAPPAFPALAASTSTHRREP